MKKKKKLMVIPCVTAMRTLIRNYRKKNYYERNYSKKKYISRKKYVFRDLRNIFLKCANLIRFLK